MKSFILGLLIAVAVTVTFVVVTVSAAPAPLLISRAILDGLVNHNVLPRNW